MKQPAKKTSPVPIALMVLVVVGGWLAVKRFIMSLPPTEQAFFYDVSARRIFTAPRQALSPIRGVDGPEEDGFRALVVSTNGRPTDRHTWTVAYLEKFTPELRAKMAAAQTSGEALAMGRLESQHHRLLRRVTDPDTAWYPMDTAEGEAILHAWTRPGPDGSTPVVCAP